MSKNQAAKIFLISILGMILIVFSALIYSLYSKYNQDEIYYLDQRNNRLSTFDKDKTYKLEVIKAENERIPTQGSDPYFIFTVHNNKWTTSNKTEEFDVMNVRTATTRFQSSAVNTFIFLNDFEKVYQIVRSDDSTFIVYAVEKKCKKDEYKESVQSEEIKELSYDGGCKLVRYDKYTCKLTMILP